MWLVYISIGSMFRGASVVCVNLDTLKGRVHILFFYQGSPKSPHKQRIARHWIIRSSRGPFCIFSWLKYQCMFKNVYFLLDSIQLSHGVNIISPDSWPLSHHCMLHLCDHFHIPGVSVRIVIWALGTFQSMYTGTYFYFVALQWTPKWTVWCGTLVWVEVNDASWQRDWEKVKEDHQAGW